MHGPGKTSEERVAGLGRLAIDRAQRPRHSRRPWVLVLALLAAVAALAAGGGWWYYRTTGVNIAAALTRRPVRVTLAAVPRQPQTRQAPVVLLATGRIVSDRKVNVATKVSGQIVELNVEQGDHVEQDQVLARIEDVIYRAQRDEAAAIVSGNKLAVARAETEHVRAAASVTEARADLELEQRNYQRLERLRGGGQASDFEFLNARNRYQAAAAALEVAQAAEASTLTAIELARSELAASESVLRIAQKRLDDCAIVAPIAGVILERNAQVGDFLAFEGGRGANANAQLVSIADMSLLRVEIDVTERDVHRLYAGQRARITPDANPAHVYDGSLMWIDPLGNYAKATVQVKVRIENPGPDLRVEGSAKVEFLGATEETASDGDKPPVQWLPKSMLKLTPGSDEALVFSVIKGRAAAHPVRIGARSDTAVEVLSGVYPGMELIAEGLAEIEDGAPVEVTGTVDFGDL